VKKMIAVVFFAVVMMVVSPVMAASFPNFDFDGSVVTQYRWDTAAGAADTNGGRIFFRLNANSELSKNVDLYARFAAEGLSGDKFGWDYAPAYYNNSSAVALDRFGIIIKGKDFTYKIGRQDGMLGQGLLYDSTPYMGSDTAALDGLIAWGKSGATNLTFVATRVWGHYDPNIYAYAVDASYSPAKDWKIGGTLSQLNGANITNFWAVNTAYTAGKATFGAEYGGSDDAGKNTAYAVSANYNFDDKNSGYVIYSKVGATASMAGFTTYDSDGKGMYYGISHKISKDCTGSLFYKDMKKVSDDSKYSSLRATVTYKF